MNDNPLLALAELGQSVWLDQLRRDWIGGGRLAAWIAEDGLAGVTSNPSIFQEAIAKSEAYDEELATLAARGLDAPAIYDALTLADIRAACDVFRPVHDATGGLDGFVSHEVSPELADDTVATIAEARRLWEAVDRPNVLIKIPATLAGLPAVRLCLAEGININITLMFSLTQYDAVAEAYLSALEDRVAAGEPLDRLASVASFFVSRVDTAVDAKLDGMGTAEAKALRGKAAIANARRAYRRFGRRFAGPRWEALAAKGARVQRVLWASTSTKDPAYRDVMYVEELVGPQTVNTLPLATMDAFRDHGRVAPTLEAGLGEADATVAALAGLGIDLEALGEVLVEEGVEKFSKALAGVLETVAEKREAVAEVGAARD